MYDAASTKDLLGVPSFYLNNFYIYLCYDSNIYVYLHFICIIFASFAVFLLGCQAVCQNQKWNNPYQAYAPVVSVLHSISTWEIESSVMSVSRRPLNRTIFPG